MPYASRAQQGYLHAKEPDVAAVFDADIRAKKKAHNRKNPLAHKRVSKGWKRDVGLGLATGTIGGVVANQLPQNQTPTKKALKDLKKKAQKGNVNKKLAGDLPTNAISDAKKERRKATAQALGYGATAAGTGAAGTTITAARYTPERFHKPLEAGAEKATSAARSGAGKTTHGGAKLASRALHETKPGKKFVELSRWAKKNPKKAGAAALGLKGAALATGIASGYRHDEARGLSHDIGTSQAIQRSKMKKNDEEIAKFKGLIARGFKAPQAKRVRSYAATEGANPEKREKHSAKVPKVQAPKIGGGLGMPKMPKMPKFPNSDSTGVLAKPINTDLTKSDEVSKVLPWIGSNVREYTYLPENVRTQQVRPVKRRPLSPTKTAASARIMQEYGGTPITIVDLRQGEGRGSIGGKKVRSVKRKNAYKAKQKRAERYALGRPELFSQVSSGGITHGW